MQGSGVTNYHHKPWYAFTAATTEFDNALVQHGVIEPMHAVIAEGANYCPTSKHLS